ncbi:MAG: alcohol dehydrogenase catalytic domain-containing protein [Acidimicrobiia bacterium]|nr:alcohol dehydrogenase catalytic domain-containing protein [Acidimicrobiia bacterium]
MSIRTAHAMVLVEPKQLTASSLPMVDVEHGGWLAVESTGITGVDVQAWAGTSRSTPYPLVPGHEVVGRIAEWAGGPSPHPIGTRVVLETSIRCGACRRCLNDLSTCTFRQPVNAYGRISSTHRPALWGGLAEYIYIDPGARMHVVTDDVEAAVATFAHPLAAGFTWAVELPHLSEGENVMILGPGPRGLASLIAAKAAGAAWVGISGLNRDTERLAAAERLGADLVVDATREDVSGAVGNSLGARPDVVVDVTGDDPDAIHMALDLVRGGGRITIASTKGVNAVNQLFSDVIVLKELSIRGAFGASSTGYHWATRQLGVDPRIDQMVSHEFPLTESSRAIQAAAGILGTDELMSVAVTV